MSKLLKALSYIVNPLGAVIDQFQHTNDNSYRTETGEMVYNDGSNVSPGKKFLSNIRDKARKVWNDYTGQTQIEQQLQANKDLAQYQSQMQEELYNKYSSPEAIMRQNIAAGLNPNLAYGSASSGQSNVPSYDSPSAPLNLSYSQKFDKALAMINTMMATKNLVYSTTANREAAQQSYLKTLQENEKLNQMMNDNRLNASIIGSSIRNFLFHRGKRYQFPITVSTEPYALDYYAEAIRNGRINQAMRYGEQNKWDFGKYHAPLYGDLLEPVVLGEGIMPNAYWDNLNKRYAGEQRKFNFDWDNDYKTVLKGAGIAGPILQSLIRIFGK